jgi:hypothetical protein
VRVSGLGSDELTKYRNKVDQLTEQFIRISVEIAADGYGIREAGWGTWVRLDNCSCDMHTSWYVQLETNRDAAGPRRAIQSAREGACCRPPSRRCTAQDFEMLTWMPFWPERA